MKAFITGGAGYIGSNLTERLLNDGHDVTIFDNFSTGQIRFLEHAKTFKKFNLVEGDLLKEHRLNNVIGDHDVIFHLAANADVRFGTENTYRDLEQNTIATHNVLEAMRKNDIGKIVFASTGSVYGEPRKFPHQKTPLFLYKHLFMAHPN